MVLGLGVFGDLGRRGFRVLEIYRFRDLEIWGFRDLGIHEIGMYIFMNLDI